MSRQLYCFLFVFLCTLSLVTDFHYIAELECFFLFVLNSLFWTVSILFLIFFSYIFILAHCLFVIEQKSEQSALSLKVKQNYSIKVIEKKRETCTFYRLTNFNLIRIKNRRKWKIKKRISFNLIGVLKGY